MKKVKRDRFLDSYNLSGRDIQSNKNFIGVSKSYRKELVKNITSSEKEFMEFLKSQSIGFEFQKIIYIHSNWKINQFFIADFSINGTNILIEIDGKYHDNKEQVFKDKDRTIKLYKAGYKVIRFTNEEIKNPFKALLTFNKLLKL